jgi:hypothetical protein
VLWRGPDGTKSIFKAFMSLRRLLVGKEAMSVLSIVAIIWVTLNAAIFAAMLFRRPRPELRQALVRWAIRGAAKPEDKSRRRSQHSHA